MAQEKSLSQSNRNFSKAQIEAKQKTEDAIVTNSTEPKQNAVVKSRVGMQKLFDEVRGYNENFTEADSLPLNTLTYNLYIKLKHEREMLTFDLEDERYEKYLLRLEKFDKKINECMKQLCVPLNARLALANEMAKVMIEEKKLEKMKGEVNQVNPLLELLEGDND